MKKILLALLPISMLASGCLTSPTPKIDLELHIIPHDGVKEVIAYGKSNRTFIFNERQRYAGECFSVQWVERSKIRETACNPSKPTE